MPDHGYPRYPTIAGNVIVFTAEDDLWRVATQGGRAERLTAGAGAATYARFAPDGQTLAFVGREEGPEEVFLLPATGGPSQRLTYQGAPRVRIAGWRPDGSQIIFASDANQFSARKQVLFTVSPHGGDPVQLPYGVANAIAVGPQGITVLGRNIHEPAFWKRYRGGTAGYFWIDREGAGTFHRFLNLNGDLAGPCWVGERFYFISDHEGIGNIYSCLADSSDLRRHSHLTDYYARNLTSDGQRLVYHAGGELFLLDPTRTAPERVAVELPGSQTQRARRFVPAAQFLEAATLNPAGNALSLVARGKAFSMDAWDGPVLQHGAADGIRYRHLTWLAGGQQLAGVQDDGTEPRLVVFAADAATAPRVLSGLDIGHVVALQAAPVGDQVALVNHRNEYIVVDLTAATLRILDTSAAGRTMLGADFLPGITWSPDGRWVAYPLPINAQQSIIKIAEVATGASFPVTEAVRRDFAPAFDPLGRYLYFLSARDFDPVRDTLHFDYGFPKGVRPYLVTLRRDLTSPFDQAYPSAPAAEKAAEKSDTSLNIVEIPPVEIDRDAITTRIVAFPVPEGRYWQVQGTATGVLFSSSPVEGTRNVPFPPGNAEAKNGLDFYDFATYKSERLIDGITNFAVTADGKTLLYRAGDRVRVVKAGEKPPTGDQPGRETGWVDLNRIKISLRPAAEWRQMYDEAWRLQREQYWIADMGGINWQMIHDRYAPLVDRITSRGELSDVIWEMQGELGTSHAYEFGGDYRPFPNYRQGYLGVDLQRDPATGEYAIARIVQGDPWNRDATSPLLAPGVNVQPGDVVLAINGQPVTATHGPHHLLVNQAGSPVQLTIRPGGGGAPRQVIVRALASEYPARYRDWVTANRQTVHTATNGRVGYIHIPDMGAEGYAEFHRGYLAEYDHAALIVDIRWNGGGEVSGLLLEKLARPRLGYDFERWNVPNSYFQEAPRGPLVTLTDENAGSDGDIFSHSFKMMNLGPLIGQRTWGGVIGIEPYIPLADGSLTTQPEYSFWFRDVGWGVENYGTDPTIPVEYPPQAYTQGIDPQLDRGIAEALRLIAEQPSQVPTPGPRPKLAFPPQG